MGVSVNSFSTNYIATLLCVPPHAKAVIQIRCYDVKATGKDNKKEFHAVIATHEYQNVACGVQG